MTSTPLSHPLVRDYLEELDAAFTALPPEQARELREQITAHLDDALTAAAGDQEVATVLQRLGRPPDIAAEAVAPARVLEHAEASRPHGAMQPGLMSPPIQPGQVSPAIPPGLVRAAEAAGLAPPGRRSWKAPRMAWPVSALLAVVVIGAGYLIAVESAPTLQPAGASIWWYQADRSRGVLTHELTGEDVWSTPIHSGQMQGFVVTVINNSDWTQTVLGPIPDMPTPGGPTDVQIATGYNRNIENGGLTFNGVSFTTPSSIRPHQIVALRVIWRTTTCQDQGGGTLVNQVELRVRVGGITRTETIPLGSYWTLSGPSAQPNASNLCV